jgi:hypothetical protein
LLAISIRYLNLLFEISVVNATVCISFWLNFSTYDDDDDDDDDGDDDDNDDDGGGGGGGDTNDKTRYLQIV